MGRTSWGRVVLVYGAGVPAAIALGKIGLVAPLMQPDLGLSLPQVGWAVSVITAVAALFGTPMGLWTRRYGARRALLAGLAVMAVGGGAGAVAGGLGVLLAARVVEGVGYLLVVIAGPVLLVRLTAEADRAAALALWGSVIPVGLALGAAVGGPLAQTIGWRGWLGMVTQLGSLGTLLGPPLFTGVVAATDWPAVAPLMLAWALVSLALLLTASAWRHRVPGTVPGPPASGA